ncbi:MAG: hypothetical protein ACRETU_09835 [Steroidobacterales bacterium]
MRPAPLRLTVLTGCLGLLLAFTAGAVPVKVGAVSIELPAPAGTAEISEQLPTLRKVMESVIPQTHRVLAIFAAEEDAKHVMMNGESLTSYMMVVVPRDLENFDITDADFENLVSMSKAQLPSLDEMMKSQSNAFSQQATDAIAGQTAMKVDVQIGETKILGLFADEKHWLAIGMLMGVKVAVPGKDERARTLAGAVNTVHVRQRVLFLYVYHDYESDADRQSTQDVSRSWVKATLDANAPGPVAPAKAAE